MSAGIRTLVKSGQTEDRIPVINQDIRALSQTGDVLVTVELFKHHRSLDQNAMWWAMCREIATLWNESHQEKTTPEVIARDLKVEFGIVRTEYSPVSGKRVARIVSTAEYTKAEMSALIDATMAWALETGLPIRDPRC